MTGAFTSPLLFIIRYKCQPNLSLTEQPLLPALEVLSMVWVIEHPSQARQQKCCRIPMTQHTPAEHQGMTAKQDLCH